MADFVLSEMLLMSATERRARRIPFHPSRTIIIGRNSTGKSALIKSIYMTFGAEPYMIHPRWTAAQVTSAVRFSWRGNEYIILRNNSSFGLFDANRKRIRSFSSISRELAPFLAEFFGFELRLPTQQGEHIVPPPAFLFLPFYVDQDGGWTKNWNSFSRLRQFSNWRRPLVEYHTGIRGNEFYELRARLDGIKRDISETGSELRVLQDVLRKVREEAENVEFDLDLEAFRDRIQELLRECEALNTVEERLRANLVRLFNQRTALNTQVGIVENAIREAQRDYRYATEKLVGSHVECPTCGAVYENSFAERFSIAQDEERLLDLLAELRRDLSDTEAEIETENAKFSNNREEILRIRELLEAGQAQVTLATVLKVEGGKQVNATFRERIRTTQEQVRSLEKEQETLDRRLRNYTKDTKSRADAVKNLYLTRMRRHLQLLDVQTLSEASYREIDSNIREMGSELPRALLAYYVSILHVMQKYAPIPLFPVVIDSPNQQAQDDIRLPLMLEFIRDHLPEDTQLVLGLEDAAGLDFGGRTVHLTEELHLLQQEQYASVTEELTPLLRDALAE